MKPFRLWYLLGIISLVITSGFQLLIPQFIRQAVDSFAEMDFVLEDIAKIILHMFLTSLAIAAGRLGWRYFLGTPARKIETELRKDLFSHLMNLDGPFYEKYGIGDLMARATNDMQTIRRAASMALVAAFDGIFLTVSILIIMFTQTPELAAYTIIPLPAITILLIFFGRLIGPLFKNVQEGFANMSGHSQATFTGIRVIKSFVKERFFLRKFAVLNDDYRSRNMRLVSVNGVFFPIVMFLSGLTIMILLLVGGRQVLQDQISHGQLVATLSYLQMLIWPMLGAGFTVNLIQRGAASLGRINSVMEQKPRIDPGIQRPSPDLNGEIRLEHVSVRREQGEILSDINISISPGSLVGITGPVGGGKTTLIHLLPRLTEFDSGRILINGSDIRDIDLGHLRSYFGFVPQKSFLFSASIRDNIAFGVDSLEEQRLDELVRASSLDRDLPQFPQGWETVVGEKGITISGGQKQRTSIARALARFAPMLLLDDPLSAVDSETEERILTSLLEQMKSRSAVIVSNRISTLKHCDHIIVLENGRVSQQGTHEKLASEAGYYRNIARIQQLSPEVSS